MLDTPPLLTASLLDVDAVIRYYRLLIYAAMMTGVEEISRYILRAILIRRCHAAFRYHFDAVVAAAATFTICRYAPRRQGYSERRDAIACATRCVCDAATPHTPRCCCLLASGDAAARDKRTLCRCRLR